MANSAVPRLYGFSYTSTKVVDVVVLTHSSLTSNGSSKAMQDICHSPVLQM